MSLKKLFLILLGIQFALVSGLMILTLLLFQNQEDLNKSRDIHFKSYLLADELRQSSDDLTRMARAYVVNGNVEFEREYWVILDIRNGKSPRPVNYNRIYRDFVAATGQKPRPDGDTISLHDLMLEEGFTKAEFEKLTVAHKISDGLVNTERIAMNAVKGLFDDGKGNFTVKKKPNREMAIRLMNDEAYYKTKAEIMKPIDEFYIMFEKRTATDVSMYEQRSTSLLRDSILLIIVIMGMLVVSFVTIQRQITERKRAEEALQESEKRYHRLIENASITSTWFPWSWPELNLLTGFSMSLLPVRGRTQTGENIFPRTRNLTISLLLPLFIVSMFFLISCKSTDEQPIKAGILHSLTGTMAISEKAVVNGTLLAIEEINQLGGINGQKILPLIVDGKSDLQTFKQEAERLITEEKVSVVFGCWTSASRKTVLPVFEKHNHLLFYPVQYEGLEQSPNIIYTGAAPNQQIIPAVKWCFDNLGKRFFLVGSDYVFPHTANEIIKQQANLLGAKIVGEDYILLGSSDVKDIIQKIIKTKPDVIINTINGSSNIPFFREMRKAGITPDKFPVMSFSISEEEIGSAGQNGKIPLDIIAGNYAAWNYFQSIESEENKKFVEKFKKRYGAEQVISDPVEAGYFGVYLWAQAVKDAGTSDVNEVLKTIKNQSMQAPEGMVYIDADNNHTWKTVRIGKIKKDGQFQIVWSSNNPVRPIPYPATRNKLEWDKFLSELFKSWDGKWEKTK